MFLARIMCCEINMINFVDIFFTIFLAIVCLLCVQMMLFFLLDEIYTLMLRIVDDNC